MKKLLPILLILISNIFYAQNIRDFNCKNGFKTIKTELKSEPEISYKIIFSTKFYGGESFEFSQGLVVIKQLNKQTTPEEIGEIFGQIGV